MMNETDPPLRPSRNIGRRNTNIGWCCCGPPSQRLGAWCSLPTARHAPSPGSKPLPSPNCATVTGHIEAALSTAVGYAKINYLMLMMVDPHVHFHVIPRYEGERSHAGLAIADAGWPKMPALAEAVELDAEQIVALRDWLKSCWPR